MKSTRTSLLRRVKDPRDAHAWREFVELYRPLLVRYSRARGLSHNDAEDIAQSCLETITRKMPEFEYDRRRGRFRGWLKTMVNRRIQDALQQRKECAAKTDDFMRPQDRERSPEEIWEQAWLEEHLAYCLRQIRPRLEHKTYEAFQRYAIHQWPVDEICQQLGMTRNQVYIAKTRVTQRLREAMTEVLGDNE